MISKKCFKCKKIKELDEFYKHSEMQGGYINKCKECTKKDVRLNRKKKRKYYREYDKNRQKYNFNRMFLHRYSGMKVRVIGKFSKKYKSKTKGKSICTRDEFVNWCFSKNVFNKFMKLHRNWEKSNFVSSLSPSIDRVDNSKGYIIENLQWITQGENSAKMKKEDYKGIYLGGRKKYNSVDKIFKKP